jgi:hypothetical protein
VAALLAAESLVVALVLEASGRVGVDQAAQVAATLPPRLLVPAVLAAHCVQHRLRLGPPAILPKRVQEGVAARRLGAEPLVRLDALERLGVDQPPKCPNECQYVTGLFNTSYVNSMWGATGYGIPPSDPPSA